MRYYIFTLIIIGLVSCISEKTNGQSSGQRKSESLEINEFRPQFSNKAQLTVTDSADVKFQLDSIQYINWTNKYVPCWNDNGRNYSAELYSIQPQVVNFNILSIRTNADDWNKLHLITVNEKNELVDKLEISNSWSDLLEQAGDVEIVGKSYMYSNMISNREYKRIDIRTTEIINYYDEKTTYETDSIVTKIEVLNSGMFKLTKSDSIRTVTHTDSI